VYQWGDIGIGRRFSDRQKKNKLAPSRVAFKRSGGVAPPKKLTAVYAGGHSTFALDEQGTAWFWGSAQRRARTRRCTRTTTTSFLHC